MKKILVTLSLLALGAVASGCAFDPAAEQDETQVASSSQQLVPGDCKTDAQCPTGESCEGIPHDNSTTYGKCHSIATLPGEGLTCSASQPCQAGLSCTGLSMGPQGTCAPSWMVTNLTNNTTYGTTSNVIAYGLASVPVDVVVKAQLNLTNPSALTLRLTDPNGTVAVVCSPTTTVCTTAALSAGMSVAGITRDDRVNGRWTLQVLGKPSPKIRNWSLYLSSRWD